MLFNTLSSFFMGPWIQIYSLGYLVVFMLFLCFYFLFFFLCFCFPLSLRHEHASVFVKLEVFTHFCII